MVGIEFLNYANDFKLANYVGVEDFADKLNFLFTVVILLMCTTIISIKQYLMKPIACYIPNVPSGSDFDDYLENYCWVHGTIPLRQSDLTPQDGEWDLMEQHHRINYYQWVPFMLGIQCIMFYTPRILWQMFCYNRTGTDLENIIKCADSACHKNGNDRMDTIKHIAHTLEEMFFQHRDFRVNKLSQLRRRFYNFLPLLTLSKRLGTWLIIVYLIIKVIYLSNCIFQLYLMKEFLGFNSSMSNFGYQLLISMYEGKDWRETLYFPRISFCNVDNVRQVGARLRFTAQCALPINMLNEKIYIFLWFWVAAVCFFTAMSIPVWLMRMGLNSNRVRYVKKYLRVSESYLANEEDKRKLKNFVNNFLRHDGVFLFRMISLNAGDLVATEILGCLWEIFKTRYSDKDLCHYLPDVNTEDASPDPSENFNPDSKTLVKRAPNEEINPYLGGNKVDLNRSEFV